MSSLRFLSDANLPGFLKDLGQVSSEGTTKPRRVLVPVHQGRAVVFAPYTPEVDFCMYRANVSPKDALLPACETLLTYRRTRQEDGHLSLEIENAAEAIPTVIFGCRPCDARGLTILDRPFTEGPYKDPYYQARRDNLLVISRACNAPRSTCFCHWVGSHPHDTEGSDILLIDVTDPAGQPEQPDSPEYSGLLSHSSHSIQAGQAEQAEQALQGGYLLQAITPAGEALLVKSDLPDGTPYLDAARKAEAAARAIQAPAPDISCIKEKVASLFNDMDFWHQHTAACRSCGACTYFCPACYCFNITDEGDGMIVKEQDKPGRRLRTWDNCMAAHFTREASGHNARTLKAHRMRNRVSHKFGNYPTVWDGAYSCTGCGRCINQCPVHMDMRELVMAVVKK